MVKTTTTLKQKKSKNGGKSAGSRDNIVELGKKTRFSSTRQPKVHGPAKSIATLVKQIRVESVDAQREIGETMLAAISAGSVNQAKELLKKAEEEQPKWGMIYQETIRAVSKKGLDAIIQVLEWIYGKRSQMDINLDAEVKKIVVEVKDFSKKGEK